MLNAHALKKILAHKLNRDISWTIGSFFILAVSGIVINLVIATFEDSSALGVFNQSYAIYIIISQMASFGIHYSVLRYSAYYKNNIIERKKILSTASLIALILGSISAIFLFFLAAGIGNILESNRVGLTLSEWFKRNESLFYLSSN